jgi:hypothetical protein
VAVESSRRCTRFGFNIYDRLRERLVWRDMPELSKHVPFPQLSVVRAGGAHIAAEAANTLLVYLDEAWDERTAAALRGGLEGCARYDAGLALLVLFREGLLETTGPRLIAEVERFAERLGIAAIVNEDVRGSWSRAFGLRSASGQPGWCLLSPGGGVTWTHLGRATPELLATALDTHLHRSPRPVPVAIRPTFDVGAQVDVTALQPGWFDLVESRCPPPPLGRGGRATVVTFVQRGSGSSEAQLRTLFRRHGQRDDAGPLVMVVVDGADAREAEALKHELGVDFVAVADPTGSITDRFGVGTWPTTVTLDQAGTVSGVEIGAATGRVVEHRRGETAE